MATNLKYKTTKVFSYEELQFALKEYAKNNWKLHTVLQDTQNPHLQTLIFEKQE